MRLVKVVRSTCLLLISDENIGISYKNMHFYDCSLRSSRRFKSLPTTDYSYRYKYNATQHTQPAVGYWIFGSKSKFV